MGEKKVVGRTSGDLQEEFVRSLLEDVQCLDTMIREGHFETNRRRIGAEQEMFLVDGSWGPLCRSLDVLSQLDEPRLTTELALFNLEANLTPLDFGGSCLRQIEQEITELLETARGATKKLGGDVLLTGILPTLSKEHLAEPSMTPLPRYRHLSRMMREVRGEEFRTHIKGLDELHASHDSVMFESCNTSFQIHFQVDPEEFPRLYNLAQVVSAPVLAAGVNSPVLLQRRLWHETRVALFQQSTDTRSTTHIERGGHARVSFGNRWIENSVLEIFREDIARFRILICSDEKESSKDALSRGEIPSLRALRMHNSTVYRWNRPCYGITDGKPHLRIENRILPSGPTVIDEVANAAFFFGLMSAISEDGIDVTKKLTFDDAKANFVAAARYGLNARFRWIDGFSHGSTELIRDGLLPLARQGLLSHSVDSSDVDRYLGIIEKRVASGQTGAQWSLDSLTAMSDESTADERCRALVEATARFQKSGKPVHEWELAKPLRNASSRRRSFRTVGQVMRTDLFTAAPDDLIDLAASVMDWKHVRHVPVEDTDGRLAGLLSHRQLLRLLAEGTRRQEGTKVREIMTPNPVTVTPETPTTQAIRTMRAERVGCLPVVDGKRLVGIVTERDFIRIAADLLDQWLEEEDDEVA